jgi:signal transduction histidine kinase/CheY-like chemotaxis protein
MPSLVTKSYLRQRFWLAGLTIGLSVVLSLAAGWYMLSAFHTHGRYSKLFTDLMQATSIFEAEMSAPPSSDEETAAQERLSEALQGIARLYSLMRYLDGDETFQVRREWQSIEKTFRLTPEVLMERYDLRPGSMPARLRDVWETYDASGTNLATATIELLVYAHKMLAIHDRSSPRYQAYANYLRTHGHERIWPFFQTALDAIGKSTAESARLGFLLLVACAGAVCLMAIFNAMFIFTPVMRTVLNIQRALVLERDRALESERAKRDFLALMSHELRTPMNGVLGFTNLLLSSNLTPKQKEHAETVQKSGLILLDLINDILDISNIETGALELESSNFSLEEVVAEVTSLLGPQAFAKRLDISAYVDPALPETLAGDVGRLRQILLKLASNAIKFTEEGGIAIEVRASEPRADGTNDVSFGIIDTGIGIPADHLARIFDHFTQVDSSSWRKYQGAGLGLPICKQLVELMGGKISVESKPDQGSTFSFNLRLKDAVPPSVNIRDSFNADLTRKRCLVVDDNALNRRIVRLQLEGFGAEVDTAPDAQSALINLAEAHRNGHPYHIAIIDHMMPSVDGLHLRRLIREHAQYAALKLILSSSGEIAFDQQARALGFDAACPKPVVQEKLVMQVYELLQRPVAAPAHAPLVHLEPVLVPVLPVEPPKASKPRLLVAEDNPINQRLISTALKQAGFVVDMVGDGVEAVHAVQRLPYDLILMDIRMPHMTGVEATQRIRSLGGRAGALPIIAMTANTMIGDREEYIEAGMNDYVPKPIDFPVLLGKIAGFLGDSVEDVPMLEEPAVRKVPSGAKLA